MFIGISNYRNHGYGNEDYDNEVLWSSARAITAQSVRSTIHEYIALIRVILQQLGAEYETISAEIDLDYLIELRQNLPALAHQIINYFLTNQTLPIWIFVKSKSLLNYCKKPA